MLFLDNAAPDSCCAERPLHIPTYPRLVSTAATVPEKTWEKTERITNRPTDRQTDRPTDYNNPSLRMRARGLQSTVKLAYARTYTEKYGWQAMVHRSLVNQPVFSGLRMRARKGEGKGRKKRSGQTRQVFEIAWNVLRNFAHLGARRAPIVQTFYISIYGAIMDPAR